MKNPKIKKFVKNLKVAAVCLPLALSLTSCTTTTNNINYDYVSRAVNYDDLGNVNGETISNDRYSYNRQTTFYYKTRLKHVVTESYTDSVGGFLSRVTEYSRSGEVLNCFITRDDLTLYSYQQNNGARNITSIKEIVVDRKNNLVAYMTTQKLRGNNIKFYYDSYGDTVDWIEYINYRGNNYSKTISEINTQFDFYERTTAYLCDEKYDEQNKTFGEKLYDFFEKEM